MNSWTTHIWARADHPPKPGNIETACGQVAPNVIPMYGEIHEALHPCKTCLRVASQDRPARSERRYFTFLIPQTRLKQNDEKVIVREKPGA